MKQVTMRDVQVNFNKLLDDIPFEVTRFGKTVAIVNSPEEKAETSRPTIKELKETTGLKTADELKTEIPQTYSKPLEEWGNKKLYCQICHVSPAIYFQYNYSDGSGQGDGIFCKSHVEQYQKESQHSSPDPVVRNFNYAKPDFQGSLPKPEKKKKEKSWP